jgi:glycosyltransferase involved in cell wall biosynthesis
MATKRRQTMSAHANPTAVLSGESEKINAPPRVAVICDFPEERWPSMDLVGEMLFAQLASNDSVTPNRVRPAMKFADVSPGASIRLFGRFGQYPRLLRKIAREFDLFHIVDHSYAHLVHELPPGRAIVTCHDLDTFRCLLEPRREPRSFAFRMMTRRILSGFQAAAHVTCDTAATRDAILRYGLLPEAKLTVVHNGVHPALSASRDRNAGNEVTKKLSREPGLYPELLHVGSTIARKRIDVLLRIFAEVRKHRNNTRLIRVGSPFTREQESLATTLGVRDHIDCLEHLDTPLLAACYRRAALVLQTSESEGFGLPVIEALACGTPVIASDIAPLREIGGDAAIYRPVGDVEAWAKSALDILSADDRTKSILCARALQQASRFTWTNYAQRMVEIYRRVLTQ